MLGARFLVTLLAVLGIASPGSSSSVQPGWDLVGPTEIVFVGDYVNLTVVGPDVNLTAEYKLTDPTGVVMKFYYAQLENGSATWNFSTAETWFPQNATGTWRAEVGISGSQVAYVEFAVLFDELTFLARRQALLEQRLALQDGIIANLLADNHDLHSRIDLVLIFVPIWIIIGTILFYWSVRYVSWPLYKFLVELRMQFGTLPQSNLDRLIVWLAAPWSGSEQEQFHVRWRLLPEPEWPSKAYAQRVVKWKAKYDRPPRGPVKKVRVVVRHRGDSQ